MKKFLLVLVAVASVFAIEEASAQIKVGELEMPLGHTDEHTERGIHFTRFYRHIHHTQRKGRNRLASSFKQSVDNATSMLTLGLAQSGCSCGHDCK